MNSRERVSNEFSQVLLGGRLTWSGSPTFDRSSQRNHTRRKSLNHHAKDDSGDEFGDDFDDFEEGAEAGEDDDFGDFDDGFEDPTLDEEEEEEEEEVEEENEPQPGIQDEAQPIFVSRLRSISSQCILARGRPSVLMLIL